MSLTYQLAEAKNLKQLRNVHFSEEKSLKLNQRYECTSKQQYPNNYQAICWNNPNRLHLAPVKVRSNVFTGSFDPSNRQKFW